MEKHIAIIGVIIKNPTENTCLINNAISEYRKLIIGRLGIPKHEPDIGIISLIVEGPKNEIDSFEKKLNSLNDVTVNTVMASI